MCESKLLYVSLSINTTSVSFAPTGGRFDSRPGLVTQNNELTPLEVGGFISIADIKKLLADQLVLSFAGWHLSQFLLQDTSLAVPIHEVQIVSLFMNGDDLRKVPVPGVIPFCVHNLIDLSQTHNSRLSKQISHVWGWC